MSQGDPFATDPPDRLEDERSSDERGLGPGGLDLGGLDLGGMDLGGLLQQAQQMQEHMLAAQQELIDTEVTGTVGDGLVTVTVDGTGELRRVRIRKGSFDPDETEDLEDMIVAAYRDARARSNAMAAEKLGPLAGGLGAGGPDTTPGLPPGF
jgi:DNA-binding YbaB/EbfC family protein